MNPPDLGVWRRSSPFAIVFFLGSTIKAITGGGFQLVASFGTLAYLSRLDFLSRGGSLVPLLLLVVAAIGGVALFKYWHFRFRVEDDRILIRQGIVKRTSVDLPFDRIQGINVDRSLVDRALGLVTIRLDTAGTSAAEGRLPSVGAELADWLRTRVDGSRREARGAQGDPEPTGSVDQGGRPTDDAGRAADAATGSPAEPGGDAFPAQAHGSEARAAAPADQVLLQLGAADMLRIGISDRTALVFAGALAAVAQIADPFEDRIVETVTALWDDFAGLGAAPQAIAFAVAGLALLALLLTAAFASSLLRHHNFTLWRRGTALRSRGGLLTQKGVVVETAKIQQLVVSQNPILRLLRRYRFSALPAGAIQLPGGQTPAGAALVQNLTVPLLDAADVASLRGHAFGSEADGIALLPWRGGFARVSPHYVRVVALRIAGWPLAAMTAGTILMLARGTPVAATVALFGLACVLAIALALALAFQVWRRRGYLVDGEGMASRRGFLGARVDAFLFRKAQSVSVKVSPLQRRRNLATLEVHLASGVVTVPYLDLEAARALRDYILYKVESSPVRWH